MNPKRKIKFYRANGKGTHDIQLAARKLKCNNCGLIYKEFFDTGLLGCSECYGAFREPLSALLLNIHGTDLHVGKLPLGTSAAQAAVGAAVLVTDIEKLLHWKRELGKAVLREDYEYAAALRDKIRLIEDNRPAAGKEPTIAGEPRC